MRGISATLHLLRSSTVCRSPTKWSPAGATFNLYPLKSTFLYCQTRSDRDLPALLTRRYPVPLSLSKPAPLGPSKHFSTASNRLENGPGGTLKLPQQQERARSRDLNIVQEQPSGSPGSPPDPSDAHMHRASSSATPAGPEPMHPPSTPQAMTSPSSKASLDLSRNSLSVAIHLFSSLSHRLNILTGTDYTPITFLRSQISSQEIHVRNARHALAASKTQHQHTIHSQSTHQKEVVQLLERKHSWSPTDLERYMSLIRSEHANDSTANEARKDVEDKEKGLEEARQALEKMERRMYHEEQVWSDTIRRNSTWVTAGLMGLNIALLLVNIVVVEPWRRQMLVREVESTANDAATRGQRSGVHGTSEVVGGDTTSAAPPGTAIPASAETQAESETSSTLTNEPVVSTPAPESLQAGQQQIPMTKVDEGRRIAATEFSPTQLFNISAWKMQATRCLAFFVDLFKDTPIVVPQIKFTLAFLEGVAVGSMTAGLGLWILISR